MAATPPQAAQEPQRLPCEGVVLVQSWAGLSRLSCTILAATPKRYRVRMHDTTFQGRFVAGQTKLVPRHAVRFT